MKGRVTLWVASGNSLVAADALPVEQVGVCAREPDGRNSSCMFIISRLSAARRTMSGAIRPIGGMRTARNRISRRLLPSC